MKRKVKLQILKNLLDHTQKVYRLIEIPSKFIDQVEYLPAIETPTSRTLFWVRREAYEAKGTMEIEIDA